MRNDPQGNPARRGSSKTSDEKDTCNRRSAKEMNLLLCSVFVVRLMRCRSSATRSLQVGRVS